MQRKLVLNWSTCVLLVLMAATTAFAQIPNWSYPVAYSVGNLVLYSGTTYQCLQAHTSNSSWTPPATVGVLWNVSSTTSPPDTPTNLTATPGNAQVQLSWVASLNDTSFNIYRGTSSGHENATPIATGVGVTGGHIYTDSGLTNGTTYYYKIAGVNGAGTSALSAEISATPTLPVQDFSLFASQGPITSTPGHTSQAIVGVTDINGFTGTVTFSAANLPAGVSATFSPTASTTSSNITFTLLSTVTPGTYTVTINGVSGSLHHSATVTLFVTNTPPATPTGLTASAGSLSVSLFFQPSTSQTSFNVYRGLTKGGESATPISTGNSGYFFSDSGLSAGVTYYYKVAAVNAAGTSGLSNEASATPTSGFGTIGPASINCGGAAASPFVADTDFRSSGTPISTSTAIDTSLVGAPIPPQAVFQSQRAGNDTYTLPGFNANTQHRVSLYFAEIQGLNAGQRKFNIVINGATVATNFDIAAAAGAKNKGVVEYYFATADTAGNININLTTGSAGTPTLAGISIN